MKGNGLWHLLAILTVIVWGTSFVSTKVLLNYGFSVTFIFLMRFVFTYLFLLLVSHTRFRSNNWLDETSLFVCGFMTTLYFWFENTALNYSNTSNVSLIVCTNPLMILIMVSLFLKKERLSVRQVMGSLLTFVGMVLVVLNGHYNLQLSPKGDLLALLAAIVWVVYSICIRRLQDNYPTLYITRKIFLYAVVTAFPFAWVDDQAVPFGCMGQSLVIANFLLLTMGSSLFGYVVWNAVLKRLGTVLASNYIYAVPLVTMITAAVLIDERITMPAVLGGAAIVGGMILAEYNEKRR